MASRCVPPSEREARFNGTISWSVGQVRRGPAGGRAAWSVASRLVAEYAPSPAVR